MDQARELWDAIVEHAGLDLKLYDHDLLLELADTLGLEAKTFQADLDRRGVTAQTLLQAVFRLVAPYAEMMSDILSFFARVGARATSDNLRIRFDFGSAGHDFDFALENFRDWETRFREVMTTIAVDEIDDLLALQLRHAFVARGLTYDIVGSRWSDFDPADESVAQWIGRETLLPLPRVPAVEDVGLRSFLERVWRILHAISQSKSDEPLLSTDDIHAIVRGAYLLSRNEAVLLERLAPMFAAMPFRNVETKALVEQLLEIFNLPVWKRRSELYSIWVGARLMTALGDATRVHVVDRTLVFAFGGTHLATVQLADGENLHVWCELRTEATAGVVGKGRKRRIQPDYVVLREPTSHANSAALVVECKQYLRQSRKGFADALIDYASNHTNSTIVLVNYGAATSAVLDKVGATHPTLLPRTHLIAMMRPQSTAAIAEFDALVRLLLPKVVPVASTAAVTHEMSPVSGTMSGALRLTWSGSADLDLHCWLSDANGMRGHVDYSSRTATLGLSRVELDRDVQTGGETETLSWDVASDIEVNFAVFAYTPDVDVVSASPTVEINLEGAVWMLQPTKLSGRWWNLFRIERGGSIRIWNSIANNPVEWSDHAKS